jgi:hypothetical protein
MPDDGERRSRERINQSVLLISVVRFPVRPNALPLHNVRYPPEDGGPTTENIILSSGPSSLPSRRALSHSTKLMFRIGRIPRPTRRGSFFLPGLAVLRRPISVLRRPNGGARRDRTDDLMLAKHALSQLSYGPGTAIGDRVADDRSPIAVGGPGRT